MKKISLALGIVIVVVGCAVVYYVATMDVPVVATEHGEHGEEEHGSEHAHSEGEHSDEDHSESEHKHDDHSDGDHAEEELAGHDHEEGASHSPEGESDEHGHEERAQHAEIDEVTAVQHGLKLVQAGPVELQNALSLPGEIALDANRVVHVVPRLTGVAGQVTKNLGDKVAVGDLLAIINSRELADVKSDYLAALERRSLAETLYSREKELYEKKISAAQDYLSAKQSLAEEDINIRSAEQKLLALGLTAEAIKSVRDRKEKSLTDFPLTSPINGTVIEKHLASGEFVDGEADAFVLADLSQVWVSIVVYAADLKNIREGQLVLVQSEDLKVEAEGKVAYIGALVGEETRTARATVELANPDGLWRPGLFVTVEITQDKFAIPVGVPVDAIQTIKEKPVVFVREGDAIEARPIEIGRSDGKSTEILAGLKPGEMYVAENSYLVKADIEKAGAAHEH